MVQNARCVRVDPEAPWMVSASTGLVVPPACRTWLCDACGPARAKRTARALDAYGFGRGGTITPPSRDARQGLARLAYLIRKDAGSMEWAWTIEHGPRTGMVHAHALIRGPWIENRKNQLTKLSRRAGHGFVYIKPRATGVTGYVVK